MREPHSDGVQAMVIRGWTKSAHVNWDKVVAPHAYRVPIRNLRELLWEETLADGNTQERFERWAGGARREVRFEVDTRIAAEMKHGFVPDYNDLSLYDIQREAEATERDDPKRAEWIYMGLIESLGIHFNIIDDSGGEFWPLFEECMKAMGNCIKRQSLTDEERRWRIEYLAGWSLAVFSDFMEYYETELEILCISVPDLEAWRDTLAEELKSDDIDDRACYWAARKQEIEASLARVTEMIENFDG